MMKLNELSTVYTDVLALLDIENQAGPTTSLADLETRYARRARLDTHINTLRGALHALESRASNLPSLPALAEGHWAQAVLTFPNLAFLEVDTDGLREDADILRIVLVETDGTPIYSHLFKPHRSLEPRITRLTAITPEMVENAPALASEWDAISHAFAGRFVLSFNLAFDLGKLRENASRYALAPFTVIGECLQRKAHEYFAEYSLPKLASLCERIGFPLPEHPHQDAFHRIQGQIHLLQAMAQGGVQARVVMPAPQEQDGDPFLPDFPDDL